MNFRIADTFTDSLAKLTGDEQKAVKTTAFDMQLNPANPGFSFHKLDKAKDKNFWSVRVNTDIRLIVHKTSDSLLLCCVGHHDNAYQWAEKRKLEIHPRTGATQLVEIRERIEEITVVKYIEVKRPLVTKPVLFAKHSDDELLGYGVPVDWLNDVRQATEDTILELADHLPGEAAEALLDLAVGVTPKKPEPVDEGIDPFHHPDAQRRFRVMNNVEELARALDYPWEKWTVFLHPAQRQLVERDYNGPAKVSGSAGTGKTILALHRAVFLARKHPEARVLLTTFSDTLANALATKLKRLIVTTPHLGERLEVHALTVNKINGLFFAGDLGQRIFQQAFSWKSLGVDIRGRSRTLHINYRTSHQIRMQADHLLGPSVSDVDGNIEDHKGTVSVSNGPPPAILMLATPADEIQSVSQWLAHLSGIGIKPHEMGVFVRSEAELDRAIAAVSAASLNYKSLDEHVETVNGHVSICTMHLAKGLEFRAVVVMACDDEVIPSQQRIETVTDDADLEDGYETERHLLYVACTRARDHLLVTSGDIPSEFIDDLNIL
jgi:mRNA-degrading endonuclease RelE of RelBE toxin-antitoxin system